MSLQLVHQVKVDKLLLDCDTLVVDDVGEQPERLAAQMEIIGGTETFITINTTNSQILGMVDGRYHMNYVFIYHRMYSITCSRI